MDITIVIKSEDETLEVTCCKDILSKKSDYFRAMFDSNMRESSSEHIQIEFREPHFMQQALKYLHGGQLTINSSNVSTLTEISCMFQMKELKDLCTANLLLNLNEKNALRTLVVADMFCLNCVYNRARNIVSWNLYHQTKNSLGAKKLLQDWLNQESDLDACANSFTSSLYEDIAKFESGYDHCLLCFDKDLNLPVCSTEDLVQETTEFTSDTIIDVSCENRLSHSGYYGVCTQGQYVYVSGGQPEIGGRQWYHYIWRLDLLMRKWEEVVAMDSPRRSHGFTALGDCLYLVGGYGKYRVRLRSTEEYNVVKGEWRQLADLPLSGIASSKTIARTMESQEQIFILSGELFTIKPKAESNWTKINMEFPYINAGGSFSSLSDVADFTCSKHFVYFVCTNSNLILAYNLETCDSSFITTEQVETETKEYLGNVVMIGDRLLRVYRSLPTNEESEQNYHMEWFNVNTFEFGHYRVEQQSIAFEFRYLLSVPLFPNFRI